jgi:hypothetical protein
VDLLVCSIDRRLCRGLVLVQEEIHSVSSGFLHRYIERELSGLVVGQRQRHLPERSFTFDSRPVARIDHPLTLEDDSVRYVTVFQVGHMQDQSIRVPGSGVGRVASSSEISIRLLGEKTEFGNRAIGLVSHRITDASNGEDDDQYKHDIK